MEEAHPLRDDGRMSQDHVVHPFGEGVTPLSGDSLAPFRVAADGLCWWCSAPATTREHKFKRTDLARMWGDSPYLLWGSTSEERLVKVRGPNSQVAKFKPNLCMPCNSTKSQTFDAAYDQYADFVWRNMDLLWGKRWIDMAEIYGSSWRDGVMNLAKYFAKHIGCRIVDDGFKVPRSIPSFLDGVTDRIPDVHMVLFKDPMIWRYRQEGKKAGVEAAGLHMAPAFGAVSPSRKCLTMYSGESALGLIGIKYRWEEGEVNADPFYLYRTARLYRRDELPDV